MSNTTARALSQPTARRGGAFTLVELLAVILVIALLIALTLGVSTYLWQGVGRSKARAQIAALSSALEAYKGDWGYYPATGPERVSADGAKEATNNWYLYRALSGVTGKQYLNFQSPWLIAVNPAPAMSPVYLSTGSSTNAGIITTNYVTGGSIPGVVNIYDPWGRPYVYYNSPATAYSLACSCTNLYPIGYPGGQYPGSGYCLGGQINLASYDLFSFGPDQYTYVPGAAQSTNCGGTTYTVWGNRIVGFADNSFRPWTNKNSAADDISNGSK